MPLDGHVSLCDERQSIVVSQDSGTSRKHRAVNSSGYRVSQYKIDGGVVRDTSIRCDFLVMNDDKQDAYLIELKGSDIEHALDQLEATARRLQHELRAYQIKYRIVCSRAKVHAIRSNNYKRFVQKHNKANEFICKEKEIKEEI